MTPVSTNFLSIGELSRLCGLSAHALRYYEAEGLLQPVTRGANGHRRYLPGDVLWLEFVLRLKQTGMPLADIRQYAGLRAEGDGTLEARLAMLKLHRQRLDTMIEELSTNARALDAKMRSYRKMIASQRAPKRKAAK